MDIRKYRHVKRTTAVEIKLVEREQDLLIEEFPKRPNFVRILAWMYFVKNSPV